MKRFFILVLFLLGCLISAQDKEKETPIDIAGRWKSTVISSVCFSGEQKKITYGATTSTGFKSEVMFSPNGYGQDGEWQFLWEYDEKTNTYFFSSHSQEYQVRIYQYSNNLLCMASIMIRSIFIPDWFSNDNVSFTLLERIPSTE